MLLLFLRIPEDTSVRLSKSISFLKYSGLEERRGKIKEKRKQRYRRVDSIKLMNIFSL